MGKKAEGLNELSIDPNSDPFFFLQSLQLRNVCRHYAKRKDIKLVLPMAVKKPSSSYPKKEAEARPLLLDAEDEDDSEEDREYWRSLKEKIDHV